MIVACSIDTSRATSEERPANGVSGGVSGGLCLLRYLALALAMALVGLGLTSTGLASAGRATTGLLAASIGTAAPESADTEGAATTPASSHHWGGGAARPDGDLKAVEIDIDEDDPLCEAAHGPPPAFRCVPLPGKPDRASRGELQNDTSRFAAGTGLPRGPPTA